MENQDLPPQFPNLQKTEGNFHWTLHIDKSVSKVAGWLLGSLIVSIALATAAFCYAKFAWDKAIQAETELEIIGDWLAAHGVEKREDGKYYFRQEKLDGE